MLLIQSITVVTNLARRAICIWKIGCIDVAKIKTSRRSPAASKTMYVRIPLLHEPFEYGSHAADGGVQAARGTKTTVNPWATVNIRRNSPCRLVFFLQVPKRSQIMRMASKRGIILTMLQQVSFSQSDCSPVSSALWKRGQDRTFATMAISDGVSSCTWLPYSSLTTAQVICAVSATAITLAIIKITSSTLKDCSITLRRVQNATHINVEAINAKTQPHTTVARPGLASLECAIGFV